MREIRMLRATWRGLETWRGQDAVALPARQSSTLLMSGEGKRSPWPSLNAAAPFLDSTIHGTTATREPCRDERDIGQSSTASMSRPRFSGLSAGA